ncbi:putative protein N(5)-glutamine methyltransferase [Streptomyces sp. ODS28]|uniref:putative protein N(5)-glutamine methyltransferase n=1 Tax=Streptomyces sp. ODS28 TaxID=3136688 RepID=UPI0031F0CB06
MSEHSTARPAPRSAEAVAARLRAAGCVFAEEEARLLLSGGPSDAELDARVERRAAGRPLEQVLGWAEFCGLRIAVEEGVFVPRRRTEFLVRHAAALAPPRAVTVDLCCGSGALGAAMASGAAGGFAGDAAPEVYAADIDPAAVRCARRNLAAYGGDGYADGRRVGEGDLFTALPGELRGRVQVLLANVPYVPTDEMALLPPEAREHEARAALDGGADGLGVLRRVAAGAPEWLAPGGVLLFETSERQAPEAVRVAERCGLAPRVEQCAELYATVVTATRRDVS